METIEKHMEYKGVARHQAQLRLQMTIQTRTGGNWHEHMLYPVLGTPSTHASGRLLPDGMITLYFHFYNC